MMSEATVKWLSSMPRGTTLLTCVAMILTLGGWVWALDDQLDKQDTVIAVVSEKVEQTEKTTADTNDKIKDVNDKLDQLLALVIEVKIKQDIQNGTAPKPKGDSK